MTGCSTAAAMLYAGNSQQAGRCNSNGSMPQNRDHVDRCSHPHGAGQTRGGCHAAGMTGRLTAAQHAPRWIYPLTKMKMHGP